MPDIIEGRSCGACTLCCTLLAINEIGKPKGEDCPNCDIGKGCQIYSIRPGECRNYYCDFLTKGGLADYWYPGLSHIVMRFDSTWNRLNAYVDPDHPGIWKTEPYYSDLRDFAASLLQDRGQVVVRVRNRAIVVLPDKEVDLGDIGDDDLIVTVEAQTPAGVEYDAIRMKLDDPRVQDIVDPATDRSDI